MEAFLTRESAPAVLRHSDLFEPFVQAFTPEAAWRVGTEAEKFGVLSDTFAPLPYAGERSVQAVLSLLAERFGWHPEREYPEGEVIALLRGNASITLEPGGQVELSGAPFASIHDTAREWEEHLRELHSVGETLGITWLGLGFHPFATQAQLSWVPKLRYGIMREYLPTRGSLGLDMMRRTCTVQANIDYASEADAMDKMRILLALSPVFTAMFANSPLIEGRPTGERTHRARIWLDTDRDRTGLLRCMWSKDASFESYIAWALDVPMFLIKRNGKVLANTGQTFRAFMRDGFQGARATQDDWVMHLGTLFPEVRLKRTIEVRGVDSTPRNLEPALPALVKGLVYDETSRTRARELVANVEHDDAEAARSAAAAHGLQGLLAGRPMARWAEDVLELAHAGLDRLAAGGRSEAEYLAPLEALAMRGQTPADALLAQLDLSAPLASQVVTLTTL